MVFGLLNINKPPGPTSHDIVMGVRRGVGVRRVGHAGTLDPMAQGVLVLALGQAARLVEYLSTSRKSYLARITLGIVTDTLDSDGTVIAAHPVPPDISAGQVEAAMQAFRGEVEQMPPVYSAIKVNGKPAHARVRAGEKLDLKPRRVLIEELRLVSFSPPTLELFVVCSAGTYIRSLARDLGQALGCGATLSGLTRVASGRFCLEEAVAWETLQDAFIDGTWCRYLLPADLALDTTPQVRLDVAALERVWRGMPIPAAELDGELARAYAPDGRFVAVLVADHQRGVWLPKKVFSDVFLS